MSGAGRSALPDFLIIGGGIIGVSLAWRLRQRGATVTLVERGAFPTPGRSDTPSPMQATWAAAGMLAPLAGMVTYTHLVELGLASLELYPAFCADISEASGIDIRMEGAGRLTLALNKAEVMALQRRLSWQPLQQQWLSPEPLRRLEPRLSANDQSGVLCSAEQFVRPRELLIALCEAAIRSGVQLCPGVSVESFTTQGSRVEAAVSSERELGAGEFILAAGAWAEKLTQQLGATIPIAPVKGQALELRGDHGLTHTISTSAGLLSPRGPESLWVGATEEPDSADDGVSVEGIQRLLSFAAKLLPHLQAARIVETWAGYRPGIPDNLPVLGLLPGWDNVHIAGGHFRKGILLAPLTADLMTTWTLDHRVDPYLRGLGPERFLTPGSAS